MKNDNIDKLFQKIDFDTEEPLSGHEQRFLKKLNGTNEKTPVKGKIIYMNILVPIASIAATVALALLLFGGVFGTNSNTGELASVFPEMKETQDFYTAAIQSELHRISSEKTPETEALVKDALLQLDALEKDHEKLRKDLVYSGNDKRVIFAMITNYQQRIELLENVMQKIEEINQLKNNHHENNML